MTAECSAASWAGLTERDWTLPLAPPPRVAASSLRRTVGPDVGAPSPRACGREKHAVYYREHQISQLKFFMEERNMQYTIENTKFPS